MKVPHFEVLATDDLAEFRCQGTMYVHQTTGARVYHLAAADKENLVAFVFPTAPSDSTGVAHILEHSVLCGSKNYPTKDPFLYLYKSSLNTFLNAMTYPDKTLYPVASIVPKDFDNLLQVYADAVFFPLLKPQVFAQEGHRLEWDDEGGLVRSGVVFNEMKGNYSSSDNVIGDLVQQAVFEQGPYSHDSGGNPRNIPELTYQQFLDFHRTNYHPSRALVFLYGDLDPAPRLKRLHRWFKQFGKVPAAPLVALVPRWKTPRLVKGVYPASKDEASDPGTLALTWLCADAAQLDRILELDILSDVLLGDAGLLQKALLDSGLGQDISPVSGLMTEIRDVSFTVGLRGAGEDKREAFEALVLGELARLAEVGLPTELIESVIASYEFSVREVRGGGMGLRYLSRLTRGWLHGVEAGESLRFQPRLEALKLRLANKEPVLERLIRSVLLENPHRATVVCSPDANLQDQQEQDEQEALAARRIAMSAQEIATLKTAQASLKDFQELPDAPSAVRKLPELKLRDIPSQVDAVQLDWVGFGAGTAGLHRVFTNGVLYVDLSFDMGQLTDREVLLLPLLQRCLDGLGLVGLPHELLARELATTTGGLYLRSNTDTALGSRALVSRLFVRLKMLEGKRDAALALLLRVLTETNWDNLPRFRDLVEEQRNDFQGALVPRGHAYAATRSAFSFSPAGRVSELTNGLTQMEFLVGLAALDDAGHRAALADLRSLTRRLLRSPGVEAVFTGAAEALPPLVEKARALVERLDAQPLPEPYRLPATEVLLSTWENPRVRIIPATVGFVAHTLRGSLSDDPLHAAELVLSHRLKTGYLWEEIRMKGGAYGAFSSPNGLEGVFTFATYRDPGLISSLDTFRQSLVVAREKPLSAKELKNTIIGTVSNDLSPRSPSEEAFLALQRKQLGISDALRQRKRDALLAIRGSDLDRAAARLEANFDAGSTFILTGRKIADEAVAAAPGRFIVEES